MKKILLLMIVILAVLSVSCVSAEDNITDVMAEDAPQEPIATEEVSDEGDILTDSVDDMLGESQPEILADTSTQSPAKTSTKITAQKVKGYQSFTTRVSFKLTAGNKPLASKKVSIVINGVEYTRTTDANGMAGVRVDLKTGTYKAKFTYSGDNSTESSTATSKIIILKPIKTTIKVGDKDINYRQGSKCLFYVKVLDKNGKFVKKQTVTFKVNRKTLTAKTDSRGIAKIYVSLKKGKHKIKYSLKAKSPYLSSSGSYKIKVKSKLTKGNGYWLWPAHMHSVNLKSLSQRGTKHILLHSYAVHVYGKSSVQSFIREAHRYGIKVHLWVQVAYDGNKWVSLVDDSGKIRYGFINSKVAEAKSYARISGVDGIHFDYIRYGGTAHKHPHAVDSINCFAKRASIAIHKIKPNCIVSAALMPEPNMMHYYYGQDVATMSRYMDALIPMVYKGNYHKDRNWIYSVTKTYVKQSSGAQIWTGLQSYHSDSDVRSLSQTSLAKDSKAAMKAGAKGIILFRIGISCNFNFKKVKC